MYEQLFESLVNKGRLGAEAKVTLLVVTSESYYTTAGRFEEIAKEQLNAYMNTNKHAPAPLFVAV